MKNDSNNKKKYLGVLLTGASSGIGKAFAKELARKQSYHNLVLVARREERLRELERELQILHPEGQVHVLPGDVRTTTSRTSIIERINILCPVIDLLVNNAGFGSVGAFTESTLVSQLDMVEVNCVAPLHFIHHYLPLMAARKGGTIINVASVCAFQPMPYMATYGATKAFLESLSISIGIEANKNGVLVVTHCPGPTESEFHIVAGLKKKLDHLPGMTAEVVVQQALRGADRGRLLVINGLGNSILVALARWLPITWGAKLVAWVLKDYQVK